MSDETQATDATTFDAEEKVEDCKSGCDHENHDGRVCRALSEDGDVKCGCKGPTIGHVRPWSGGDETKGASGKFGLKSLKKNPYRKFTAKTNTDTWFGSVTEPVMKLALHLCNGYIWEARNSDRFYAQHSELHRVEACRDRLNWLVEQADGEHFWPQMDEWEQLALIDFIRLLPYMWD